MLLTQTCLYPLCSAQKWTECTKLTKVDQNGSNWIEVDQNGLNRTE